MSKATHVRPSNRNGSQEGFMFAMKQLISFEMISPTLAGIGFNLNRVHFKPAKAQLMLIFERGVPQVTSAQDEAIFQIFLDGYSYLGSVRRNDAVAPTSDLHKGTPEHVLISLNGATPRTSSEKLFRLNSAQQDTFRDTPQVRLSLNLPEDMVALIPAWVEKRER